VVVEAVLLFVGFAMGGVVAMPILARIRRTPQAGFSRAENTSTRQRAAHVSAGFTPLDLGEDPVQWPSAHPWPASTLVPAEWPSKSWNDEHFGQHWKKQAEVGGTPAQPPQPARPAAHPTQPAQPKAAKAAPKKVEKPKPQPPAPQTQAAPPQQATPQQAKQQPAKPQPSPQPAKPQPAASPKVEQSAQPTGPSLPTVDEVDALIARLGLAGTVQQLMARHGWDFRQATQFLTKIRAKR
jgi:hypothetical protein